MCVAGAQAKEEEEEEEEDDDDDIVWALGTACSQSWTCSNPFEQVQL